MAKEVVDKLNAATTTALAQPELKARLANIGITPMPMAPMPMAPEPLKGFISTEITKWVRLVKDANIQPE